MAVDVPDWLRLTQLAAPNSLGSITVPGGSSLVTVPVSISPFATGLVVLPLFLLANPVTGVTVQGQTSGSDYVNVVMPAGFTAMPPLFAVNIQPVDSVLEVSVQLNINAAAGGQLAAFVFELFGTGVEQVSNNFLQPLFVSVVPPPVATSAPYNLLSKAFIVAPAVGASTTIIAGVAGKTITVYGYDFSIRSNAAAVAGTYRAIVQDTTATVVVAQCDLMMVTAVGQVSQVHDLPLPAGIALPVGAGLQVTDPAASVATVAVVGTIFYTQL